MNNRIESAKYTQPLIIKILKFLVSCAEKKMPGKLFDGFYNSNFAFYRFLIRSYVRFLLFLAFISQDKNRIIMLETVIAVMPYSLVGYKGLIATYEIVCHIEGNNLQGSIVECGVAEGGCSALMALVSAKIKNDRHFWLFDSYEGLPKATSEDFIKGSTGSHGRPLPPGSCLGTIEQVRSLLFENFGLNQDHITLVKGWFENTLPESKASIGEISFLRIDADWYNSVRCCLNQLFDNVCSGGFILIDDYFTCHGAKKATDEFLLQQGIKTPLTSDHRGGVYFVKP